MKAILFALLAATLSATVLTAQTPDALESMMKSKPIGATVLMMLADHSANMIKAAELMPESKYSFHPTEPQMTFGKLVAHIAQTNEMLCSGIAGTFKQPPSTPTEKDSKEILVKAIRDSFDHCSAALQNVTDSKASETVDMGGQKVPRVFLMITLVSDWSDHYSTQASYLRLNGILPPSAQPAK